MVTWTSMMTDIVFTLAASLDREAFWSRRYRKTIISLMFINKSISISDKE
jgi:hypothetical protein